MRFVFTLAFLLAEMSVGLAQENQFGVAGGFGFYRDATLTNSSGTARAGFGPRFAASAVISHASGSPALRPASSSTAHSRC